jgi:hypothetical protein
MIRPVATAVIVFTMSLVGTTPAALAQRDAAPPRDGVTAVATGTAIIAGRIVTDEATPRPLRRVNITLRDTERGTSRAAVSGDDGRFSIGNLPAGRFLLSAAKPAYVSVTYGAQTPRAQGVPLAIQEGQRLETIVFKLPRGAVITGRVVDERGRPLSGQRVVAVERVMAGNAPTYRSLGASAGTSDERGVYRVYGLPAGTFLIATQTLNSPFSSAPRMPTTAEVQWAMGTAQTAPGSAPPPPPPPGQGVKLANVYHPGATDPELATPVTVSAGEERAGVDLTVSYVRTATLEGVLTRFDGQPPRGAQIVPISKARVANGIPIPEIPPRAIINPDGTFSVGGLAPGSYLVTARASSGAPSPAPRGPGAAGTPAPSDLWAREEITINGEDVKGLTLTLAPGMSLSGHVAFEATTQPVPDPTAVYVSMAAPPGSGASLGVPSQQADATGDFALTGVPPGPYLLSSNLRSATPGAAVPAWVLKSATLGGQDILDTPFEVMPGVDVHDILVTYTDRVTQLTGGVTDQAGRPVPTYSVIAFSTDSRYWRQDSRRVSRPVRPSTDGRFTIAGFPPGQYYLAVLADAPSQQYFAPAFLETVVPGAIRVALGEGEQKTQDIKLAGG